MGLITKTEVRDFLKMDSAFTTDDTLLTTLVGRAQAEAERHCGYSFDGEEKTEYQSGDGSDELILEKFPVTSITSLHDDPDRNYTASFLIASANYVTDLKKGIIKLDGLVFGRGLNNVKVVYKCGYGTNYTAIPEDLKQAVVFLASALYLEGSAGVKVLAEQDMVYRPAHLKKEAYKIFDRYRRLDA